MQIPFSIEQSLSNLQITALNEMQQAAIAAAEMHDNVVLLSATGSGKTLAFLVPVLNRLNSENKQTQAMIIVPSRELALQIESVFKRMGTGFKITCCYGGHLRETEENNLVQPPAIIVGTPGRLADHIRRGNITTDTITMLVLDEFDKSLELGFHEEMQFIIEALPNLKKRMLTSATEVVEVPSFIDLQDPKKLNFLPEENTGSEALAIQMIWSEDTDKIHTLFNLICYLGTRSTIVFCNHRDAVERVSQLLSQKGITNKYYHGALEQRDRDAALSKFRNGSTNVLVTTDLAARGLDIPNIRYIIHYHLPANEATFTHRNGRTARMDASGTAILILNGEERLPPYIDPNIEQLQLPDDIRLPEKPKWVTLMINAGKKDKVNKVDIVGFLTNKGELKKEDIGLIEVKDFTTFVAIRKLKATNTFQLVQAEKIKGKKVKMEIAK